jgi:hypothetical protein
MTSRNRETLRNFFSDGKLPTRYHFADLIDSMLNMSDEGFRKTPDNGIELSTPVTRDALMGFYREQSPKTALWSVSFGGGDNPLHFQPDSVENARGKPPVLALDMQARVGINTAHPQHALDVAGVVALQGRRGSFPSGQAQPALADGEWHAITPRLVGCQAFEVMAGVGLAGSGRFALLHSTVLNTYNPTAGWLDWFSRKRRIRCQHAWYGKRCDKLQLRWEGTHGDNASYQLFIRTGCDYGKDSHDQPVRIRVQLTQLWFDPHMRQVPP